MTYWWINVWFLVAAALTLVTAMVLGRPPAWRAVLGALGIVLLLTVVFDNVIIGLGIVGYDTTKISGVTVGIAPIEDFAYTLAAAFLIPSMWSLLGKGSDR